MTGEELVVRLRRVRQDPVVARAAPFLLFIALVILASKVESQWVVILRAPTVLLALAWFWRGYSELRSPSKASAGDWLLAVTTGFVVFGTWIGFDQDWAVMSRTSGFAPVRADGSTDWVWGCARLAGFSLVVPLMEELFWRSLVQRWIGQHDFLALEPRKAGWKALLITSVLFALEHERWLSGFLAGLAYGGLYMRSGNLWVPVLAHAVTNAALGLWILYTQNWQFW